jgi:hypothetical protein
MKVHFNCDLLWNELKPVCVLNAVNYPGQDGPTKSKNFVDKAAVFGFCLVIIIKNNKFKLCVQPREIVDAFFEAFGVFVLPVLEGLHGREMP